MYARLRFVAVWRFWRGALRRQCRRPW